MMEQQKYESRRKWNDPCYNLWSHTYNQSSLTREKSEENSSALESSNNQQEVEMSANQLLYLNTFEVEEIHPFNVIRDMENDFDEEIENIGTYEEFEQYLLRHTDSSFFENDKNDARDILEKTITNDDTEEVESNNSQKEISDGPTGSQIKQDTAETVSKDPEELIEYGAVVQNAALLKCWQHQMITKLQACAITNDNQEDKERYCVRYPMKSSEKFEVIQ